MDRLRHLIKSVYIPTIAVLVLAATTLLSGCGKGVPSMSDSNLNKGYTRPEVMMIVLTEKNVHEDLYTDQIWEANVQEKGENFKEYYMKQIRSFLEDVKVMNLLAAQKAISLTGEEEARMEEAGKEYYEGLTEEDIKYMGIRQEDAVAMYKEYFLANKLVDELTKDVDLEVSDSEAKVIKVLQIRADSEEEIKEAYGWVTEEGADFEAVAQDYVTEGKALRLLGRGEAGQVYEEAAFALAADEISQIIHDDTGYYVLKCISDYDEEETLIRKEQIYSERKRQAFLQIYDGFRAKTTLTYPDGFWEEISFPSERYADNVNFFDIYKKYSAS